MKTVTTLIVDDFDGEPDAHTIAFAIDGNAFEIDLSEPNLERFYGLLQPYVDNGRRARSQHRGATRKRAPAGSGAPRRRTAAVATGDGFTVRQWWKDNPGDLPSWQARGAIPHAVQRAYQEAA